MARRLVPEMMDAEAVPYEHLARCLRHIAAINRLTGAYRPTLAWLATIDHGSPLRILDVGCGYGDDLRRIAAWAKRRRVAVLLTGVDRNPDCIRAAREATPPGLPIRFVAADVFALDEGFDLILSALFTHHLDDAELVRFLSWMDAKARLGWFVNDLHRHPLPYAVARSLGWLPISAMVAHDAPVSVGRAFTAEDWGRLLAEAGIDADIRWRLPFRLCVERRK